MRPTPLPVTPDPLAPPRRHQSSRPAHKRSFLQVSPPALSLIHSYYATYVPRLLSRPRAAGHPYPAPRTIFVPPSSRAPPGGPARRHLQPDPELSVTASPAQAGGPSGLYRAAGLAPNPERLRLQRSAAGLPGPVSASGPPSQATLNPCPGLSPALSVLSGPPRGDRLHSLALPQLSSCSAPHAPAPSLSVTEAPPTAPLTRPRSPAPTVTPLSSLARALSSPTLSVPRAPPPARSGLAWQTGGKQGGDPRSRRWTPRRWLQRGTGSDRGRGAGRPLAPSGKRG